MMNARVRDNLVLTWVQAVGDDGRVRMEARWATDHLNG